MKQRKYKVVIALAGQRQDVVGLRTALDAADLVIAADAGLEHLRAVNSTCDWLIGDFDSLQLSPARADCFAVKEPGATLTGMKVLQFPKHKNQTDGELAVAWAILAIFQRSEYEKIMEPQHVALTSLPESLFALTAEDGDRIVALVGQEKDLSALEFWLLAPWSERWDHSLANLGYAQRLAERGATVYLSDGYRLARVIQGYFALAPAFDVKLLAKWELAQSRDAVFSVQSLSAIAEGLTVQGMRWDLQEADLSLGASQALCNETENGEFQPLVSLRRGTVLLSLEDGHY